MPYSSPAFVASRSAQSRERHELHVLHTVRTAILGDSRTRHLVDGSDRHVPVTVSALTAVEAESAVPQHPDDIAGAVAVRVAHVEPVDVRVVPATDVEPLAVVVEHEDRELVHTRKQAASSTQYALAVKDCARLQIHLDVASVMAEAPFEGAGWPTARTGSAGMSCPMVG